MQLSTRVLYKRRHQMIDNMLNEQNKILRNKESIAIQFPDAPS